MLRVPERLVALPPANVGALCTTLMYTPHLIEIEKSKCPKCGARMWLARIEPDKPDHDKRTYECPACDNVAIEVVKYR